MKREEAEGQNLPDPDPSRPSSWLGTPPWMLLPPTASGIHSPLRTRPALLPLGKLAWEDFERLCLRLLELEAKPIHAAPYGERGQAQAGIDIYARGTSPPGTMPPARQYVCLQARRVRRVSEASLDKAVDRFLMGEWAPVSRVFIYATSASTKSTSLVPKIESLTAQLTEQSVEFMVWNRDEISNRLRGHPELVDDFFGREWVREFCGDDVAERLGARLDAQAVAELRRELGLLYQAAFAVADPGFIALDAKSLKPLPLPQRFVTPDLVSTTAQAASSPHGLEDLRPPADRDRDLLAPFREAAARNTAEMGEDSWLVRQPARTVHSLGNTHPTERRPADEWIGTGPLQVVVGEPGAGKSTLLRYLVLDLLSDQPTWQAATERWGQHLPVWLPFHFFTQRVAGRTGEEASVERALQAWLAQRSASRLWPVVQKALIDKRLLLVVDGLDEWVSDDAGRAAFAELRIFADSRSVPVVASTRPFGFSRLALDASWAYARIAPLTVDQQRQLALNFLRAVAGAEDNSSAGSIASALDDFISQVHGASDIRALSGTPLFLLLLLGLHLSSFTKLPTGRFQAYDRAIQLLIADHPAQRRTAAAVTESGKRLSDHEMRRVLARVAFASQERGDISVLAESRLRRDFIDALQDADDLAMTPADAAETAGRLLTIAEGELGILVREGPREVGFLHRVFQEQLAAEYIASRLSPSETRELFARRVGDPQWREVLLATMWSIRRPQELRELAGLIERNISETPAGLHVREALAEVLFEPYGLPANDIQQKAPHIVEVIETHSYGPHRVRLLDTLLKGLGGAATDAIVEECLRRWAVLVEEPTPELVDAIAEVSVVTGGPSPICKLLVRALRYPNASIAYSAAVAIARRCSSDGPGREDERDILRDELLRVLSEMPSGLAGATALTALALEWRDDLKVAELLRDARGHGDSQVRLVAISHAVGALRSVLSNASPAPTHDLEPLSSDERDWLVGHLQDRTYNDVHWGLLVASVSQAVSDEPQLLGDMVASLNSTGWEASNRFDNSDLLWSVLLSILPDDPRVVDLVCSQLSSDEHAPLILRMTMGDHLLLGRAYPPDSPSNARVAGAIEERLQEFPRTSFPRELVGLTAVDRGPRMKGLLLDGVEAGAWPHWAAAALVTYFEDDPQASAALRSALFGDPVRASMVANAAPGVLGPTEVIPCLLAILRSLSESGHPRAGRYDIVALALIQACQEQGLAPGPELDSIAAEALPLMPATPDDFQGDPRHRLAATLYPSSAAEALLCEIGEAKDRHLAPRIRALRNDPERLAPLLKDVSSTLCSVPPYLRGRICEALADGAGTPELTMELTRRWSDEVSEPNATIASLAYHRALVRARAKGDIDESQWKQALRYLEEQASLRGMDHDASVRGAWAGACVLGEWTVLKGPRGSRVEVSGIVHGPDRPLLLQLASHWEDLRAEFGDELLERLSGHWRDRREEVWSALALVADQSSPLQLELEDALASDAALLNLDGVLAWFVTRSGSQGDAVADALVSRLHSGDNRESLASILIENPEGIGLDRSELMGRLEGALSPRLYSGDPALQALASLCPQHALVLDAWTELRDSNRFHSLGEVRSYYAVAYAAADTGKVLDMLDRHLSRLEQTDSSFRTDAFARYVTSRLRRDPNAADLVREEVLKVATPDPRAATLISLLADAVGLNERLLREVERRIVAQGDVDLAPVARDYAVAGAPSVPVRTIFMRAVDGAADIDPP